VAAKRLNWTVHAHHKAAGCSSYWWQPRCPLPWRWWGLPQPGAAAPWQDHGDDAAGSAGARRLVGRHFFDAWGVHIAMERQYNIQNFDEAHVL
jgi:hypothetical protein